MKKLFKPKILAFIVIIAIFINFIISINTRSVLDTNIIINILSNIDLYIMIYLIIILTKGRINISIRTLNLSFFICLIIYLILYIVNNVSMIFYISSMLDFPLWFTLISRALFISLQIIIVYGILFKKKMSYKTLMIALITLSLLNFIILINYNVRFFGFIQMLRVFIEMIEFCSFSLFLYLYGESINERSKK